MSTVKKGKARVAGVLSPKELSQAAEALREALVVGDTSGRVEKYLETFAAFKHNGAKAHGMFRHLSANNMALIEAQRKTRQLIGLYAGVRQWELLNRAVKDSATPLTIWVPSFKKVKKAATAQAVTTTPVVATAKDEVLTRFSTAAVYDWSDTISLDPDFVEPEWESPLLAGDEQTLQALESAATVPVIYKDLGGAMETGHTNGSSIVIDTGSAAAPRAIGNLISTLAHELVHVEMGHPGKLALSKGVEREALYALFEQEACLGEYLLVKSFGLDEGVGNEIAASCAAYLSSWSSLASGDTEGYKKRMKMINSKLESARVVVDAILNRALASTETSVGTAELVKADA